MNSQDVEKQAKSAIPTSYVTEDIQALSDREHVRLRPSMYLGSTNVQAQYFTLEEAVLLMLDGFQQGVLSEISVGLLADGSFTVSDNNESCNFKWDSQLSERLGREVSNFERDVAHIGYGAMLDRYEFFAIKSSHFGGIHGFTVAVTNFVSDFFHVEGCDQATVYTAHYRQGVLQDQVEKRKRNHEVGTTFHFKLDPSIFEGREKVEFDFVSKRIKLLAYLHRGLKIEVFDERSGQREVFRFLNGVRDYLDSLEPPKIDIALEPLVFNVADPEIRFEVALRLSPGEVISYANNTQARNDSKQELCLFRAIVEALFESDSILAAKKNCKASALQLRSLMEGMLNIEINDPLWQGSTKTMLANKSIEPFIADKVKPLLRKYFEKNDASARFLRERLLG